MSDRHGGTAWVVSVGPRSPPTSPTRIKPPGRRKTHRRCAMLVSSSGRRMANSTPSNQQSCMRCTLRSGSDPIRVNLQDAYRAYSKLVNSRPAMAPRDLLTTECIPFAAGRHRCGRTRQRDPAPFLDGGDVAWLDQHRSTFDTFDRHGTPGWSEQFGRRWRGSGTISAPSRTARSNRSHRDASALLRPT